MIVVANKTEARLMTDLRRCLKTSPVQKCFYMQFSKSILPKEALCETFLKLLEELPNSYTANVYLCADKDIFIIMQGFMQRQFIEFIEKLSLETGSSELSELIDVFEVGVHWDKLEALCQSKIDGINIEEERIKEAERKARADEATQETLSCLDTSLMMNVVQRRDERDFPIIMVVDDDAISRTLVGNVLHADYTLKFAENGKEALQEYLNCAPDVLFLDIGLPDIGGHELLEAFAQIDPDNYTIMFSGRKDKANMLKALRLGAQGFVGKPFSRDKLIHYIHKSPYIQQKKENDPLKQATV